MELSHLHINEHNDDDVDYSVGADVDRTPHPNSLVSSPRLIPFHFGVRAYGVGQQGGPPTLSWDEEGQPIMWIPLTLSSDATKMYDPLDVLDKLVGESTSQTPCHSPVS